MLVFASHPLRPGWLLRLAPGLLGAAGVLASGLPAALRLLLLLACALRLAQQCTRAGAPAGLRRVDLAPAGVLHCADDRAQWLIGPGRPRRITASHLALGSAPGAWPVLPAGALPAARQRALARLLRRQRRPQLAWSPWLPAAAVRRGLPGIGYNRPLRAAPSLPCPPT